MIAGMNRRTGFVASFSQFPTVHSFTPSCVAISAWVRPRMSLRLRRWSPKVVGSKSYGFGINDLSRTRRNGKKATQPCGCGEGPPSVRIRHCAVRRDSSRYLDERGGGIQRFQCNAGSAGGTATTAIRYLSVDESVGKSAIHI